MSQNNVLMQIQADFLGIPILRPSMTETTSLGAAIVGKWFDGRSKVWSYFFLAITLQKTHPYNIRHLFMSVADNANIIIEMYHIMHSVQSSVQSSIDDVISYCKMRQAKFSYNMQSNNFNISNSEQRK